MRIENFRCGYCHGSFTPTEMMQAYRAGKCLCGEAADSWVRVQTFPVRCGWCAEIIAWKPVVDSHGLCGDCQTKHFPKTVRAT